MIHDALSSSVVGTGVDAGTMQGSVVECAVIVGRATTGGGTAE